MLEIRITAPELSEAIGNLARALSAHAETTPSGKTSAATPSGTTSAAAKENTPTAPIESAAPDTPVCTAPVPPSVSSVHTAPPTPAASVVPTSAPQYTLDMIAKAGTALIDAGKMGDLIALLSKYGVEALTALEPAKYGAFAAELRAMGASI